MNTKYQVLGARFADNKQLNVLSSPECGYMCGFGLGTSLPSSSSTHLSQVWSPH